MRCGGSWGTTLGSEIGFGVKGGACLGVRENAFLVWEDLIAKPNQPIRRKALLL